MPAPRVVLELVERFRRNLDVYRSGAYKESQLRQEFINPLFKALGWDMDNVQGWAEPLKDVVHEESLKIGGATKAPDYCFRAGGTRKFFVEAKKPSVDIAGDKPSAYQLRRYAWSAKLPLSILTNFGQLAVFETRSKPARTDSPWDGRILLLAYTDYPTRWEEIAAVFSRDAVWKGSFEKFAESTKGKKGTAEVDDAFLAEIESWRDKLARNIALRNPALTTRQLNVAVQATIDRLVFLRICEDRGIEPDGRLQVLLNGDRVYRRLFELFQRADERYNSGLFHFTPERDRPEPPDTLTHNLEIDDNVLQDILRRLYCPESPYEFSVLPADILGQVYEQFLGKIIRLTPGHRAVVEEKPEVRKAGGVYYTPTYIVDYMVDQTLGRLLEGRTPKEAASLRILDPACGSGSFLLGAYQHLLDWHLCYYATHSPEKWARRRPPAIFQAPGLPPSAIHSPQSNWRLTTAERKRILLKSIYGVDIDPQAVEVTKLSLLLKVLEGESGETLTRQFELFHERALPDLASNIKCGNSLIGPDFYQTQQLSLFDDEQRLQINVFDWHAEFPHIMKAGGFDAIVGNPPYIRVRLFRELFPEQVDYLQRRYRCATHVWDVYLLFLERAVELTRPRGRFSFIVPIQTLHQPNCESLRQLLLSETALSGVADLSGLRVFRGAIVKNCILTCRRDGTRKGMVELWKPSEPGELLKPAERKWPQASVARNPGFSMKLDLLSPKEDLCRKLRSRSWELAKLCYVTFGLRSCAKGRGKGGKDRLIVQGSSDPSARPYLEGRDIQRYSLSPTGRSIRYLPDEMYSPRSPALFEAKKIVSQTMLSKMRLIAALDDQGFYVEQSLLCILPHGIVTKDQPAAPVPLEFILGVMNSRLESFFFATHIIDYSLGGGLVHATPGSQGKLLIPRASEDQMQPIMALVAVMPKLQRKLAAAKTAHEQTALRRQIEGSDRQIDLLVYQLYGLTDEEIRIVEDNTDV